MSCTLREDFGGGDLGECALYRDSFAAMGSPCAVSVWSESESEAALASNLIMVEVERIEGKYSRYRADSFLSEINRVAADGGALDVDDETASLLDFASLTHKLSGGLFDVTSGLLRKAWDFRSATLPTAAALEPLLSRVGFEKLVWNRPRLSFPVPGMELDFGGIGKEYAVDRAVAVLTSTPVASGLVDLAGDVAVTGPLPDGSPWLIGIKHPRRTEEIWKTMPLSRGAVATSGDYERCIEVDGRRYCHVLDPRTGWPVEGLASVTVRAGRCLLAGALATITLLKGRNGPEWLGNRRVDALWMTVDGDEGP